MKVYLNIYIVLVFVLINIKTTKAQFIQNSLSQESSQECCFDFLPVKRVYEKVNFDLFSQSVQLEWATTKELENSHFEIERAETNQLEFIKIGEIPTTGWSNTLAEYSYKDKSFNVRGTRIYYRIKQVDSKGNYEYGKILPVIIPMLEITERVGMNIFPNPYSSGELKITTRNHFNVDREVIQIKVLQMGSVILNDSFTDLTELNNKINSIATRFPKGLVIIELRWKDNFEILKLLVN